MKTDNGYFQRISVGEGLRVVSFFSGAGGLDLGFEFTGYDLVYATDIDDASCQTLKMNRGSGVLSPSMRVERHDIREIAVQTLPTNVDLVIGGPPCQSYSASGRRAGGAAGRLDPRGTLFEGYCRMIEYLKPKAFVFENVRGILATNSGKDWEAITVAFKKLGYSTSYRILDALDYGAPQQRERMFLVGHKLERDFMFPRPIFGPDSARQKDHFTAGKALESISGDFENKEELKLITGKYAHLLPLVPEGSNYLFFTAKRGYPNPVFAYRSRFSDFLYKADPKAPIKTLIASPGKYTGPFHWENRAFTIREYMRLQGFPDEYRFAGTRQDRIRQIGNSVSPKIAYYLGRAIAAQIFGRRDAVELLELDVKLSFDKRKGSKAAATKRFHLNVKSDSASRGHFTSSSYSAVVLPNTANLSNVRNRVVKGWNKLVVHGDDSEIPFAEMRIHIFENESDASGLFTEPAAQLHVKAFGVAEHTVQTMWNAVDDWVIRSSNFHSLFELYGHFTEPHPTFRIVEFVQLSQAPIVGFAKHASDFRNCSRHFRREHLTGLFGRQFNSENFLDLVKVLRNYRYDIRCHETNIAMPPHVYMVSYPFTLPSRKQMNFSVKNRAAHSAERGIA